VQEFDLHAGLEFAIEDPHVGHHAFIGVEIRIKAEGLKGNGAGRLGRRDAGDDGFENVFDADAFLGAGEDGGLGGDGENILQLGLGERDIGVR